MAKPAYSIPDRRRPERLTNLCAESSALPILLANAKYRVVSSHRCVMPFDIGGLMTKAF